MIKHPIPPYLRQHCTQCTLLVPADSPESDLADCEPIVQAKLYFFYPQHSEREHLVCATAAWNLIHDAAIKSGQLDKINYENVRTPNAVSPSQGTRPRN
jgi:hypothetical protein